MGKFLEKLLRLEKEKRKIAALVMSAAAMIVVIIIWIAYMSTVMRTVEGTGEKRAGFMPLFAKAAQSFPWEAGLWVAKAAHYLFGQREVVIEK